MASHDQRDAKVTQALSQALWACEEALDLAPSKADEETAAHMATPYLRLFALTFGGFAMLKRAQLADQHMDEEPRLWQHQAGFGRFLFGPYPTPHIGCRPQTHFIAALGQFRRKQFINQARVGLAPTRLHDLAHKPAHQLGVFFGFGHLIGIGGDDFINHGLNRACIRNLA